MCGLIRRGHLLVAGSAMFVALERLLHLHRDIGEPFTVDRRQ